MNKNYTQKEFLQDLKLNYSWKNKLVRATEKHADSGFFFTLGEIFGMLGIDGWDSERFINKVCEICNIEW